MSSTPDFFSEEQDLAQIGLKTFKLKKNKMEQRHDELSCLSLIKSCAQLNIDKLMGLLYTASNLIKQVLLRILHKVLATWQLRVMLAGTRHHEEAFAAT